MANESKEMNPNTEQEVEFAFGVYIIRNLDGTFVMNIVPGKEENIRLSDVMHLIEDAKLEMMFRSIFDALTPSKGDGPIN